MVGLEKHSYFCTCFFSPTVNLCKPGFSLVLESSGFLFSKFKALKVLENRVGF